MNGRYHCYFLFSTTRNYHHICIKLVNTLIPQITKCVPMIKTKTNIVNLGIKKWKNNYTSTWQLTRLHNYLLMSIIFTPAKDLSNVDRKSDMKFFCSSSVKLSSILFSWSIRAIYNRVNNYQKKRLMLKSYLPGINTLVFPKRHYENIFPKTLFN